jgi:hypothetical protein
MKHNRLSRVPEPPRDGDALDGHVGETRLLQGGAKWVRVAERVRANNLQILGLLPELACDLHEFAVERVAVERRPRAHFVVED